MNDSSPSAINSTPSGINANPKTRLGAAREFGKLLRRAFDSARSYKVGHAFAKDARTRATTQLMAVLAEHGELQFELTARAFLFENVAIEEARSHAESMTLPLFREGVRRISFIPGLMEDELSFLLERWISAFLDPLNGDSVTTSLWEKEAKGISMVVIDTFEAGDDAAMQAGEELGARAATTVRDQIDAIVSAIASESLDSSSESVGGGVVSISADDAALLRSDAVRGITADQLASQDVRTQNVEVLTPAELSSLSAELADSREQPMARFLSTLVNGGLLGTEAQRQAVVATFERVVTALADEHHYDEPFALYRGLVAEVAKDKTMGNPRVALLKQFRAALTAPVFIDRLVRALDAAETCEPAIAALKVLGKAAAPLLTERTASLTTPEGRQRATELLAAFDSTGIALADAKTTGPIVLIELLKKVEAMKAADGLQLMEKALHNTDVTVRRAAAENLDPTMAAKLPLPLLMARLGDNDAEVRAAMISLVTIAENPAAVPTLVSGLRRPMDLTERTAIYEALGAIGGPRARDALLHELELQTDTDSRVACAHALRKLRDPAVAAALQALASKVLLSAKLRAACRDSLENFKLNG